MSSSRRTLRTSEESPAPVRRRCRVSAISRGGHVAVSRRRRLPQPRARASYIYLVDDVVGHHAEDARPDGHAVQQDAPRHPGHRAEHPQRRPRTAKLLSAIAAGDPPDIFTEWRPEIGSFAARGDIDPMDAYLTGAYAKFEKWEYPVAVQGGSYNKQLYAVPMSLNSWALYYNKSFWPRPADQLAAHHPGSAVRRPGEVVEQQRQPDLADRLLPDTNENGFQFFTTYFGATNCITSAGKYDFANCAGAKKEMNWIASYDKYPYSNVMALQTALGRSPAARRHLAGKAGFVLSGPWEGTELPITNSSLEGKFGVESFPAPSGGASTFGQGNFNIIPKGAAHPKAAFTFMAWLAGFDNVKFNSTWTRRAAGFRPRRVAAAPAYQKWMKAIRG